MTPLLLLEWAVVVVIVIALSCLAGVLIASAVKTMRGGQ